MSDLFTYTNQNERKEALKEIVEDFKARAEQHDRAGSFPHENFKTLRNSRYPGLTVPTRFGGKGISLTEMLELQEIIAEADGSTALSIGWHMGIMKSSVKTRRGVITFIVKLQLTLSSEGRY